MTAKLAADELVALCATLADPRNPCESCRDGYPGGVLSYPGGDESHLFISYCGDCDAGVDDVVVAQRIADRLGLNVRKRFDNETKEYYRPFLTRPGAIDDHDTIGIGGDEFGNNPLMEVIA